MDDLETNQSSIIKDVLNRKAILVPYDTDRNNEPCKCIFIFKKNNKINFKFIFFLGVRNGHKAHWCIAIGFCCKVQIDKLDKIIEQFDLIDDEKISSLINLKNFKYSSIELVDHLLTASIDLNLLCKQGKSKLLKPFSFNDLVLSNKNLIEVGDQINVEEYLVPEEGIKKHLCNKFVVISK